MIIKIVIYFTATSGIWQEKQTFLIPSTSVIIWPRITVSPQHYQMVLICRCARSYAIRHKMRREGAASIHTAASRLKDPTQMAPPLNGVPDFDDLGGWWQVSIVHTDDRERDEKEWNGNKTRTEWDESIQLIQGNICIVCPWNRLWDATITLNSWWRA